MDTGEEESKHLQVRFIPKDESYSVGDSPFSIPSSVASEDLSGLVNDLLTSNNPEHDVVDFDFLLADELLRNTLEEALLERGLSSEAVLELVYFPKHQAPEAEGHVVLNDWISDLDCNGSLILSGSYDNHAYILDRVSGQCVGNVQHDSSVKSVAWLRHGDTEQPLFLTGGMDESVRMWQFFPEDKLCRCLHSYAGHGRSVDCLAVDKVGQRFCSGSWDRTIRVWPAMPDQVNETSLEKGAKRKMPGTVDDEVESVEKKPLVTLSGHTEAVSAVAWMDSGSIASASWDHSIKLWDLDTASHTATLPCSHVFNSLSYSPLSQLLVSGNADRFVRIYDPRSETSVVQKLLKFHTGWVASVDWSPVSEFLLVSGSFDKTVCQWDIRSPNAPLFSMTGHNDKVMCVNWSEPNLIVSGGADAQLRLYKT